MRFLGSRSNPLETEKTASLDEKDWRILELLATNARMSIARLSQKTNLSRDVVKYRLKKLVSERVIESFLIFVNLPRVGFPVWGFLHIRFQNITPKREQEFINFVRGNPNIIFAHSTLGAWDFGIEFFARNPKHFFELQKEVKEKFGDIIKDTETGSMVEVYKTIYVPPSPFPAKE